MELAKIFNDKKFMCDGRIYNSEKEALEAKSEYEQNGFETQLVEEFIEGKNKYLVYTRRIVTQIVIEGQPI